MPSSKYAVLRNAVTNDDKDHVIDALLREHEVKPRALTNKGGRRVSNRFTNGLLIDHEEKYVAFESHGTVAAAVSKCGYSERTQSALQHESIQLIHEDRGNIRATDVTDGIDEVEG